MALSRLSLLLALFCAFSLISADTVQPDMVVNVFRHGARGPIQDPLKMWGNNVGQLTAVGQRMHYLLGVALKDKYSNLLLDKYDPAKIILRSTDYNRTIMSVYSQLFGIYGGKGPGFTGKNADVLSIPPYADYDKANITKNLTNDAALPNKFQVLPFHVDSPTANRLLKGGDTCPNYKVWSEQNIADEESTNLFKTELAEITKTLNDVGITVKDMSSLAWVGDSAIAHKFQGLPIPGNVQPDSQGYLDLKFATEWNFFKAYGSGKNDPAIHSLYLLRGIQDYILSFLNGTSPANFVFLSGHDSTLMPVLIAFNITTKDCLLANYKAQKAGNERPYPECDYPMYASNIIFEVYGKTAETATIKFLYNNRPQPICGKTGDGSNTCTLKELSDYIDQVTKKYTYDDYNQICGIKAAETPIIYLNTFSSINILVGLACGILLFGLVYTCNMAQKKEEILLKNSEKSASLLTNL